MLMPEVGDVVFCSWKGKRVKGTIEFVSHGLASIEVGDDSYYKCASLKSLYFFHEDKDHMVWCTVGIIGEE